MSSSKFVFVVALALPCLGQHSITSKHLLERIDKAGPERVATALWNTPETRDWDAVMTHIESGTPEWLAVAEKLRPRTDAGQTFSLQITMARALIRNPNAVLRMTSDRWPLDKLCGDYEAEESKTQER